MESVPLIAAVRTGQRREVELLLPCADIDQQDEHGWTALGWAAGRGDSGLVELLLAHGADPARTGRDQRTPRMIALAAGHAATAALLEKAEAAARGQRSEPARPYCKAYLQRELARFPGWQEVTAADSPEAVLFLHEDLTVTRSIHRAQDVVFSRPSPEWSEFCSATLRFKPPDDIELATGRPDRE